MPKDPIDAELSFELDTLTIASTVPTKIDWALGWLLGYERSGIGGKLAYVRLNIQTPCPPSLGASADMSWR